MCTCIGTLCSILVFIFGSTFLFGHSAKFWIAVVIGMILAEIATIVTLIVLISTGFALEGAWVAYMALVIVLCSGMIYYDIAIVMLAAKYAMDEFILCSVLLYIDIMRMLFYLLLILGKGK